MIYKLHDFLLVYTNSAYKIKDVDQKDTQCWYQINENFN